MGRKWIASLIGLLAAILILEASVRVVGLREERSRFASLAGPKYDAEKLKRPYRILILGSSMTLGAGAPPGKSYPDWLQGMVDRDHPGQVGVFNRGISNANTRFILENLESNLEIYRPTAVVAMAGQPNLINSYGYDRYLADVGKAASFGGLVHDRLYALRSFRLFEALWVRSKEKDERSLVFPDIPVDDADSLGARWMAGLDFDMPRFEFAPPLADEAISALARYGERHPEARGPGALLGRLYLNEKHSPDEAAVGYERSLAIDPVHFNYPVYRDLAAFLKQPAYRAHPGLLRAFQDAGKAFPGDRLYGQYHAWFENFVLPYDETKGGEAGRLKATAENEAFLESAIDAWPENPWSHVNLSWKSFALKRDWGRIVRPLESGILANPAQLNDMHGQLLEMASKSADLSLVREVREFLNRFGKAYPFEAWKSIDFKKEGEKAVDDWTEFDLREISRRIQRAGIPVVFQTYPPRRHTGESWRTDAIIRRAAKSTGAPLSDTYAALSELFKRAPNWDMFYSPLYGRSDEHLGSEGYRRAAEILYGTLKERKLVPPDR